MLSQTSLAAIAPARANTNVEHGKHRGLVLSGFAQVPALVMALVSGTMRGAASNDLSNARDTMTLVRIALVATGLCELGLVVAHAIGYLPAVMDMSRLLAAAILLVGVSLVLSVVGCGVVRGMPRTRAFLGRAAVGFVRVSIVAACLLALICTVRLNQGGRIGDIVLGLVLVTMATLTALLRRFVGNHPQIRVRVVGSTGAPLSDVMLLVVDDAGRYVATTRDTTGRTLRAVLPGMGVYTVMATSPGHVPEAVETRVEDSLHEITILLSTVGMIEGNVIESRVGMALWGARVVLVRETGEAVDVQQTATDGSFSFQNLADGDYFLLVSRNSYRPRVRRIRVIQDDPGNFEVELLHSLSLTGVVRDGNGRPVAGVPVRLADESGLAVTTCTADDGNYRFMHLLSGVYRLTAGVRGVDPVSLLVSIADEDQYRELCLAVP